LFNCRLQKSQTKLILFLQCLHYSNFQTAVLLIHSTQPYIYSRAKTSQSDTELTSFGSDRPYFCSKRVPESANEQLLSAILNNKTIKIFSQKCVAQISRCKLKNSLTLEPVKVASDRPSERTGATSNDPSTF
jgi:hypothetical protein